MFHPTKTIWLLGLNLYEMIVNSDFAPINYYLTETLSS